MEHGGRGLLVAMLDVEPAMEDEFNAWYNTEHLPERRACPGFLSARRFEAIEGGPKYLAVYDLESPDVLTSAAYRKVLANNAWTNRLMPHFTTYIRNVYVEITPPELRR